MTPPRPRTLWAGSILASVATVVAGVSLLVPAPGGNAGPPRPDDPVAGERALEAAHAVESAAARLEPLLERLGRAFVAYRARGGMGMPPEVLGLSHEAPAVRAVEWLPTVPARARGMYEEHRGLEWGAITSGGAPLRIVEPVPPTPEALRGHGLPASPRFAAARLEHHPLTSVSGLTVDPGAIGMDLGALSEVAEAISLGRGAGAAALTGRSRLVECAGETAPVVRLLLPIEAPLRDGGPGAPQAGDPEASGAGFLALVLDPARLCAAVSSPDHPEPFDSGARSARSSAQDRLRASGGRLESKDGSPPTPPARVALEDTQARPGSPPLFIERGFTAGVQGIPISPDARADLAPGGGGVADRAPYAERKAHFLLGQRLLRAVAHAWPPPGSPPPVSPARGRIAGWLLVAAGALFCWLSWLFARNHPSTWGPAESAIAGGAPVANDRLEHYRDALARSEDRARAIFAAVPDAMYRITRDGMVVDCKAHGYKGLSTPTANLTVRRLAEVFPDEVVPEVHARLVRVLADRAIEVLRFSAPSISASKGAGPRHFEARLAPHGDGEALALVRDITQQADLERMKQEFLATVSHELKTPLTAIRGAVDLLASGAGTRPDTTRELIGIARLNAERMTAILNDLLDLERMAAGRLAFDVRAVQPDEVLGPVLSTMRNVGRGAGIEVADERHPTPAAALRGDARRLAQVLTNLVDNAIRYAPSGSTVRVAVGPGSPGRLRFAVSDRGPGIPLPDQARLFQRFVQLTPSPRAPHAGSGLGLAVSKGIVESLRGEIGVISRPGEGAEFWFEIPLATPAALDGADAPGLSHIATPLASQNADTPADPVGQPLKQHP